LKEGALDKDAPSFNYFDFGAGGGVGFFGPFLLSLNVPPPLETVTVVRGILVGGSGLYRGDSSLPTKPTF
jgi:hypothetical protein